MNINDLSDLAYVLEQSKNVLNTGSNTRYPKDKIHELKRRVSVLEEKFVNEVLALDVASVGSVEDEPMTAAKVQAIAKKAKEARSIHGSPNKAVQVSSGAVVIEAPVEALLEVEPARKAVTALLRGDKTEGTPETTIVVASPTDSSEEEDMAEFRRKLAEEKKKLAGRKKKSE